MRLLILLFVTFVSAAQTADEGTREIWDLGFRSKRPPATAGVPPAASRPIQYRRLPVALAVPQAAAVAPAPPPPAMEAATSKQAVGITVWQLGPGKARDVAAPRLLVQEAPSSKPVEYVPHRINLDQPLRVGDRVRVAIELPQEGFLYVVDRERYRDGTSGDPYLIFPVQNLNHGDNKVSPGRLIEIPSQADPISALKVVRKDERHIGEELLIVFSPERLTSVPISRPDTALPADLVKAWERDYPAASLRMDLDGDGEAWTVAEKAAGAEKRLLTQADPMPQSIFIANTPPNGPFLVRIPLEVR